LASYFLATAYVTLQLQRAKLSYKKRSNEKENKQGTAEKEGDVVTEKRVETDYDPFEEEVTVYMDKPIGVDSISI